MKKYFENLAKALLGVKYNELNDLDKKVIESIGNQEPVAENINVVFHEQLSIGQKLADKVASFGGSWTFILIFVGIMAIWMGVNSYWVLAEKAFDPYPFILLNLALSTLAALQAPIIMMSQNRQVAKDRLEITANYQVSLKTDLEIIRLHQKLDDLQALVEQLQPANNQHKDEQ
ncbi:hypothetical protein RED65_05609 [Oceanobacter sp. RED65]|uniref:DUF1003 domain-containing protein n=2 Tax=Bermanella marisrubri TaxID=207949 RepID=Q1N0J5_9GAMM|nr:hypothetical protein RED65_05609 [Oceanobacter sp. RED65] [Bermanella marisrubri]